MNHAVDDQPARQRPPRLARAVRLRSRGLRLVVFARVLPRWCSDADLVPGGAGACCAQELAGLGGHSPAHVRAQVGHRALGRPTGDNEVPRPGFPAVGGSVEGELGGECDYLGTARRRGEPAHLTADWDGLDQVGGPAAVH